LKEEFRDIFLTEMREEGEKLLEKWVEAVNKSGCKSLAKFTKTLKNWWEYILNYFDNRVTNGFIEGVNTKLRTLNRKAYGYGCFFMYRLRMLISF
jgi:transposase